MNLLTQTLLLKIKIKEISVTFHDNELFAVYRYDSISRNVYEYYLTSSNNPRLQEFEKGRRLYYEIRNHYDKNNRLDSLITKRHSNDSDTTVLPIITKYYYYKNAIRDVTLNTYKGIEYIKREKWSIFNKDGKKIFEIQEKGSGAYIYYYQYIYEKEQLKRIESNGFIKSSYYYNDKGLLTRIVSTNSEKQYTYYDNNLLASYQITLDDKGYIEFSVPKYRAYNFTYDQNNLISKIIYTQINGEDITFKFKYSFY
ncbi:MAG: hypothetical protein HC830_00310 [Bacteroidetes bacterium]|nr:hypothetical protein [Bacteroidota bacterium]